MLNLIYPFPTINEYIYILRHHFLVHRITETGITYNKLTITCNKAFNIHFNHFLTLTCNDRNKNMPYLRDRRHFFLALALQHLFAI